MRAVRMAVILAVALVAAAGCATNAVTGEREIRFISTADEVEMGKRIDAQLRTEYTVVTDTAQARRVAAIGEKVGRVSDRRDVEYHFALIDSGELNAFAAPGGFIYVTTELAALADDSELAAVMGHEVGHVAAGHSVQQLQRAVGYTVLRDLLLGSEGSEAASTAADIAFGSIIQTKFSRDDEYQSDDLGVKYSAKAGYDPYGMSRFFVKLKERQEAGVVDDALEILRSHPNTDKRRERAEIEAGRYARGQ